MGNLIDISGMKFGRLSVIEKAGGNKKGAIWKCVCDCGKNTYVNGCNLRSGKTKSCGCLQKEAAKRSVEKSHIINTKHHQTGTRLYRIWRSMKNRCYLKTHKYYSLYGGRGIQICDEWKNNYIAFMDWSLSHGYSDDMSIDRINNDYGYSPDNCRFIYYKDQPKNRRTNHIVTINGEKMTASECSRRYGIPISTVVFRANKGRNVLERVRRW